MGSADISMKGGRRGVRMLPRLALVLYLMLYVAAAGLVSGEVWARGGHVTFEQWAFHHALSRLGYHDHHRSAPAIPAQELPESSSTRGAMALFRLGAPSFTPLAEPPYFPQGLLLLLAGMAALLVPPEGHRRLGYAGELPLAGLRPEPPEKPPKVDR